MLSKEDNELLTRVGPGTPMGELMRQFWIPALRAARLEADGAPLRVRLLGENYVAFRATDGRVGFLDEGCPHRGVSLALARNENCGLRCIFHGWKMDVSGKVLETPSEPPDSNLGAKVKARSYPIRETGGLIWVWLGKGEPTQFPNFVFNNLPDNQVRVVSAISNCNWLQALEGGLDSSHVGILHQSLVPRVGGQVSKVMHDSAPRYEVEPQPYGLMAAAIRNQPENKQYVRVTEFVAPWYSFLPLSKDGDPFILVFVPIDDVHTTNWVIHFNVSRPVTINPDFDETFYGSANPNQDNYMEGLGNVDNLWGQNRQAMKEGNFTGLSGINHEDIALQESQGPIADRTKEKLGTSDIAVIQTRKLLLEAVRDYQQGIIPRGLDPSIIYQEIGIAGLIIEQGEDWRSYVKKSNQQAIRVS